MFYVQAAAYRIEIPPASHFGRQTTQTLKAERRLTPRWIQIMPNCSAKESAFGSFATSSALTSAANSSIALGCFSVFLRTHPSQTSSCWQY